VLRVGSKRFHWGHFAFDVGQCHLSGGTPRPFAHGRSVKANNEILCRPGFSSLLAKELLSQSGLRQ